MAPADIRIPPDTRVKLSDLDTDDTGVIGKNPMHANAWTNIARGGKP